MSATLVHASIGRDHYKVLLHAGINTMTADESKTNGGKEEGMNPFEILASALGACTCATLRMYADGKAMPLEGLLVTITLERDKEKNETNISRSITLQGDLSPEQSTRLMEIANKCPLHKTLTNPIHISTDLNSLMYDQKI